MYSEIMANIFNYNFNQGRLKKKLGASDLVLQYTLSYLILVRIHLRWYYSVFKGGN